MHRSNQAYSAPPRAPLGNQLFTLDANWQRHRDVLRWRS